MALETVVLDHLPSAYKVHLALYRNVQNAGFLHSQLLGRNSDFEYGFIDASTVFSRFQLLSAVFKAVTLAASDSLKTPNIHSEIVVSLSASTNVRVVIQRRRIKDPAKTDDDLQIADAYRRYGISPKTTDLVVVKVTRDGNISSEAIDEHLKTHVEGERIPVTDENITLSLDFAKISKYYKLNGLNWLDGIKDPAVRRRETEALILGAMALRGV